MGNVVKRDIKNAVGKPQNSAFIRNCIIYGVVLAVMLFVAPSIFEKIMVPMAAKGVMGAWYAVFVPVALIMMGFSLFRSWRRRWPLAYINWYKREAKAGDYEFCPRCGSAIVLKKRSRYSREKVGELVTTTTYTDGSQSVSREDIHENVRHTEYYHKCSNPACALEAEQQISQSHLPWKIKEIRCLVLNDSSLLGRKHPNARSILLSRLLAPILALVMIAVCGVTIYNYANEHDGEWTYVSASKESSRSSEEYQNYLMSLDTEYFGWHVTYEKSPTDMMSYLSKLIGRDKATGYTIGCYTFDGNTAFEYRFEGNDAGTGVPSGWYMLTKIDGINVLIDKDKEIIYKQGTEFYDAYAPKLQALTHDLELSAVLEQVDGGEHALSGSNTFWMEFIRKDNTMVYSYMLSKDVTQISGGEFRAVTLHPGEQGMEQWFFSYDLSEYNPLDHLDGYVYSDAAPADDELGKLIQDSFDDSGSVVFYKSGAEILEISVDYLPDGYAFEIKSAAEGHDRGLEEDAVYRVYTNAKTLTKIEYESNSGEIKTDMPLSEYQATYDFLLSIVPHAYIRSLIDMDKAEMRKEAVGLVTVYEMKDENGKVTADMKLMFGKIGEVNHYVAEDEYVKIELDY